MSRPRARRRQGARPVVVYDPDWLNPYGRETAALLRDAGRDVVLIQTTNCDWGPRGVVRHAVLAPGRRGLPLWQILIRRGGGSLYAVFLTMRSDAILVLNGTRDALDTAMFVALRTLLRFPLVAIDHNPVPERSRAGWAGRTTRILRRKADRVVVHLDSHGQSPLLVRAAEVRVIPHPPYSQWAARYAPSVAAPHASNATVLYLGALRPDKGWQLVPQILSAVTHRPLTLLIAGGGTVSAADEAALSASHVHVRRVNNTSHASDHEIAEALGCADLLVAPYVNITQSGTALMAFSTDLPIVGFDSAALRTFVSQEYLAPVGDTVALAKVVDRALAKELPEPFVQSIRSLREDARCGWDALSRELDQ